MDDNTEKSYQLDICFKNFRGAIKRSNKNLVKNIDVILKKDIDDEDTKKD